MGTGGIQKRIAQIEAPVAMPGPWHGVKAFHYANTIDIQISRLESSFFTCMRKAP